MTKTRQTSEQVKFSDIGRDEETYKQLERFVRYLSSKNNNDRNIMMQSDEIAGELLLELVKGLRAYPNLEMEQLKAVIRKMMDNRVSELKYRFYTTHRGQEKFSISLDLEVAVSDADIVSTAGDAVGFGDTLVHELIESPFSDPQDIYESKERVLETRRHISPVARKVFDAIVFGNNMLAVVLYMSSLRASVIFKHKVVQIKPWHVADALHLDESVVKEAFREIKSVYAEVLNG